MNKQINALIQDDNYLIGLDLSKDYGIVVILMYIGSNHVKYTCFRNDVVLFEGEDYKPSLSHNQDDLECIIALLGFLTLQKGAADRQYFSTYTPEQLEWRESIECESLNVLIYDFESEDEDSPHQEARDYFEQHIIQPI